MTRQKTSSSAGAPPDHQCILDMVRTGASVLDLGCGTGELLYRLIREKKARGQGIEIDHRSIYACVARGLSVFHGDIDSGLSDYANASFDYVILNQSLQQVRNLEKVLDDALRVGRRGIVGFPNFAHFSARLQIVFRGKAPVTPSLPYEWHNTPNLHFLSIADFEHYCARRCITIEKSVFLGRRRAVSLLPNLLAQTGIFLITRELIAGNELPLRSDICPSPGYA
jgi:methionine biosynthesis protein MetW